MTDSSGFKVLFGDDFVPKENETREFTLFSDFAKEYFDPDDPLLLDDEEYPPDGLDDAVTF